MSNLFTLTGLSDVAGLCDPGFFCPNGSSSPTENVCTMGYYCPLGECWCNSGKISSFLLLEKMETTQNWTLEIKQSFKFINMNKQKVVIRVISMLSSVLGYLCSLFEGRWPLLVEMVAVFVGSL